MLALGRTALVNLETIWKDKDVTIATMKGLANVWVFPVLVNACRGPLSGGKGNKYAALKCGGR